MSDLKVGDLVRIVGSCCKRSAGFVGYVCEIKGASPLGAGCRHCGYSIEGPVFVINAPKGNGAPASWLRKIPPLSELEKQEDEAHA